MDPISIRVSGAAGETKTVELLLKRDFSSTKIEADNSDGKIVAVRVNGSVQKPNKISAKKGDTLEIDVKMKVNGEWAAVLRA